jgi:drug/metabolite transporter (DMT)-like permease
MKIRIWGSLLAVYLFWGANFLAIRFAVESIPPFLMSGMRFLVAGGLLYIWLRSRGTPAPNKKSWLATSIVGVLMLTGGNGSVSWASQWMPSGVTALIVGSIPIWMILIDALYPSLPRPRLGTFIGVGVGFLGISVLFAPSFTSKSQAVVDLAGGFVLLFGSLLWSIGSIYDREAHLPISSLMGASMTMLCGGVGLLLLGTLSGEWSQFNLDVISQRSILGLFYQIAFGSLIGFVAYTWLLHAAPTALVSTYAYVVPLIAILLGNYLAQEAITPQILISAGMIIGALILVNTSQERSRPVGLIHEMAIHEDKS